MVAPKSLEFNMIRSKECFKCKAVKLLDDFYKHPNMPDGHVNKCKECNKKDVTANRNKNLERYRAFDRERGKNKERMKANIEVNRAWRAEDKRRQLAHSRVHSAIKNGSLIRQPCIRCAETKSIAHHEDYDKPLEVIWFCQPCHKERHKEINKLLKESGNVYFKNRKRAFIGSSQTNFGFDQRHEPCGN